MNVELKTLALKCPHCGAPLEVSPDMERFSCGYCGSEQVVLRRGGTVALSLIGDAIAKVQASTDKTAAELAIQRLRDNLSTEDAKFEAKLANKKRSETTINSSRSVETFLFLAGGLSLFSGKTVVFIIGAGMITFGFFLFRDRSARRDANQESLAKIRAQHFAQRKLITDAIDEKLKEVS